MEVRLHPCNGYHRETEDIDILIEFFKVSVLRSEFVLIEQAF